MCFLEYNVFMVKVKIQSDSTSGFTIVELLIVIVVIGILATISIVSYGGIRRKAAETAIKAELSNAGKELEMHKTINGAYPLTDAYKCPAPPDGGLCPSGGDGNKVYRSRDGTSYSLQMADSGVQLGRTDNGAVIECPYGFIFVPGNSTYGTSDFCVMKYEASTIGSPLRAQSDPNGTRTVSVSYAKANTYISNMTDCHGCHLITEMEWMTIAQNVLNVPENWSGGSVGTGGIYTGHNDSSPSAVINTADDLDPYNGTGNSAGSLQKRVLFLSNDEEIWDFSGNAEEWVNPGAQPSLYNPVAPAPACTWKEWNDPSLIIDSTGPFALSKLNNLGISGSTNWSSLQSIGKICTTGSDTGAGYYYVRGGNRSSGANAGVMSLVFPTGSSSAIRGFRVVTR